MRNDHANVPEIDQSGRRVPYNLRQSGPTPVEMLISTRVRKSPYWHLSHEAGAWRATVYNRMYHPRGYVRPENGGAMAEYDALQTRVTLWDVAVERQIRVQGPQAEAFVNHVVTRDATKIKVMHGKYVVLCNPRGGIVNDPILLRVAEDEFWFSISDTDLWLWLEGLAVGGGWDVEVAEIDVAPLQVQGPLSADLMAELVGEAVHDMPYYGLIEGEIAGHPVLVSQTGFSGEKGYEVYLRDAHVHAEDVWYAIRATGAHYGLKVIAPGHHRRIAAGILSWGQDMDAETSPFQVNLGWQVPTDKEADYVGRAALEEQRKAIEAGRPPFSHVMVGITLGGAPIIDYAPDFWLVQDQDGKRVGYVTSAWHSPELETNIAMAHVPWEMRDLGTRLRVELPRPYADTPVEAEIVEIPFRESANPSTRERRKG